MLPLIPSIILAIPTALFALAQARRVWLGTNREHELGKLAIGEARRTIKSHINKSEYYDGKGLAPVEEKEPERLPYVESALTFLKEFKPPMPESLEMSDSRGPL